MYFDRTTLSLLVVIETGGTASPDQVCAHNDDVDAMHREAYKKVTALMKSADADVIRLTNALSVSRDIEHMADHASKIAQDVIYLVTGELARHKDSCDNLL